LAAPCFFVSIHGELTPGISRSCIWFGNLLETYNGSDDVSCWAAKQPHLAGVRPCLHCFSFRRGLAIVRSPCDLFDGYLVFGGSGVQGFALSHHGHPRLIFPCPAPVVSTLPCHMQHCFQCASLATCGSLLVDCRGTREKGSAIFASQQGPGSTPDLTPKNCQIAWDFTPEGLRVPASQASYLKRSGVDLGLCGSLESGVPAGLGPRLAGDLLRKRSDRPDPPSAPPGEWRAKTSLSTSLNTAGQAWGKA
jgi:hypothetical protein